MMKHAQTVSQSASKGFVVEDCERKCGLSMIVVPTIRREKGLCVCVCACVRD